LSKCLRISWILSGKFNFQIQRIFLTHSSYWLAIYVGIGLTEHFVFRRGMKGYNVEDYDKAEKLPVGLAAIGAFLFGVAGMVVGMDQIWWIGPIAHHAGAPPFGGDVGFELAFTFASTSYIVLRMLEKRFLGAHR
jgi:purine-cytosine permease-like protein